MSIIYFCKAWLKKKSTIHDKWDLGLSNESDSDSISVKAFVKRLSNDVLIILEQLLVVLRLSVILSKEAAGLVIHLSSSSTTTQLPYLQGGYLPPPREKGGQIVI